MVTIEYKAPGFTLGAIISIISLIGAIILLAQKKKSKEETIEGKKKKKKLNKTS